MEKDYIRINREAYDKFAIQHNERSSKESKYEVSNSKWKEIIDNNLLIKDTDNNVLEIGPGSGRLLNILDNELHCKTTAVELSKEMIKYAKEKSPNTKFIEGNILDIDFENNSFDAIIMGALIHNFPKEDAIKLLELSKKWLKDNGRIMIYTTIHEKSEEGYYEKEDYNENIVRFRKKYTKEELIDLFNKLNFKIVFTYYNEEKDRNKKWMTYIVEKL